jgi:hypothetical protein
VASYDAVINLNVVGTSRLERVNASVSELNYLTRQLNSNLNLLAPGAGQLGDKLRTAFEPIKNFARELVNDTAKLANTLAGATAQAQVFATVLDNVKIKTGGIDVQEAAVKNLSVAWVEATLNAQKYTKNQEELTASLLKTKGLMQLSTGEIVQGTEAGVGIQGPRLPAAVGGGMNLPQGASRLAPKQLQGLQGTFSKPGMADALIGGGFPLLFGGGPGAVMGGAAGGLAGGMLGGPLGMALSIGASAIGQQLDKVLEASVSIVAELGRATETLNLDTLRDSVIAVNSDLDVTVERLIKAGDANAAQAEIAKQVTLQTGLLPEETAATSRAVNALGTAWNEVVGAVSGLLSIIGTPLVTAIAVIAQGIAKVAQGITYSLQLVIRTSPPLALLEKLFTAIGNALPGINEEQEKIKAEIEKQSDSLSSQISHALALEAIDKRRNKGNSAAAKINNNELDRQAKQLELSRKTEKEIEETRLKYKGQNTQLLEKQIKALAEIEKREINSAAALQREGLELEKINEKYGSILNKVERTAALGERQTMLAQLAGALTEEEAQMLNTLNEQSAVIDTILAKRQQLAELEQGGAGSTQLAALVDEIIALENKQIQLQISVNQESLARFSREIEAAAAAATRSVDLQIGALQGQQTLQQSQYTLMRSINDMQLQRIGFEEQLLTQAYEQASSLSEQKAIQEDLEQLIYKRFNITVANAEIERLSSLAQIQSGVELLKLEVQKQEIQYLRLVAVMKEAAAQGLLNQAHIDAVEAQYGALQLSAQSLEYAIQNAAVQSAITDSLYKQKVEAAGFARNMELSALAAKGIEGSINGGSTSNSGTSRTNTITVPTGTAPQLFADGGYVNKPTPAVVGEGGEAEYIIPASKMQAAMERYAAGQRGSSVIPTSVNPQVSVTTGPVMNMDGRNYVSQQDFMTGLQTASKRGAEMALQTLGNSYSARRAAGIA